MMKSYIRGTAPGRCLRHLSLTAVLAGSTALAAQAQFAYTPTSTTNVAGTFTDLGTTGSVIATTSTDDANSAAQNIGFTFSYNGGSFTQFVLNTNGLIRLGSAAPSAANMFVTGLYEGGTLVGVNPLTANATNVNLLMPFNTDLQSGTGGAEYRVSTTGTSPNQVCTIQWKNVSDKADVNASQYASFTFQVKLYETTNVIEFVYAAPTAGTGTAIGRYPNVGIKGNGPVAGQDVLGLRTSSASAWSTTTFFSGNYSGSTHNYRANVGPDAGRTYRFTPVTVTDAAVTAVYTLGKILVPSGLPHAVQALITNSGTVNITNLVVTLSVTGANTINSNQTIALLAAGTSTTVTFANYPTTLALGTNTVTVTIPTDDVTSNNSASQQQLISSTTISYIAPDQPTGTSALGNGTAAGILASKFTASSPVQITAASVYIVNTTSSPVGRTMYAAVLSSTGVIVGRSADYVVTTADLNTNKTLAITTPPTLPVGDYYVGIGQPASTAAFYPVGLQAETPTRPGAFYAFDPTGGAPEDLAQYNFGRYMIDAISAPTPACSAPTNLAASNVMATSATITFTPAASGVTNYQIFYGPTGFDPTSGGNSVTATTSPYTLTGLTGATVYQIYIRSNCTGGGNSALVGPITISTPCPTTSITSFPYAESFENISAGQSLPCGISRLDVNGDGTTWAISTENPRIGTRVMRYNGVAVSGKAADDWFFTPGLVLTPPGPSTRYQVAFYYRAAGISGPSPYTESLEVKSGLSATVAGQTNLLYTNNSITNTTYALAGGASTPVVALLPTGTSTQYVGFHVKSAADQGNLYIDDVSVTSGVYTATTSEALLQAVAVFPNPSATGVFTLEVHGANATAALEVQVSNVLGQRVFAGTARDNATTKLDLSHLAPGLYHLRVRNGDETLVRQLSIGQ